MRDPADIPEDAWMDSAACIGCDPHLFYPARGGTETVKEAKTVCATCPVRAECLAYALDHGERFGVWGGLSERQRRRLAMNRPRTVACQLCGRLFECKSRARLYCDDCRAEVRRRRNVDSKRRERAD